MIATQRREAASGEGSFFHQVIAELRKATWPSREEATRLTIMVVLVSSALGLFLWLVDSFFSFFVQNTILGG